MRAVRPKWTNRHQIPITNRSRSSKTSEGPPHCQSAEKLPRPPNKRPLCKISLPSGQRCLEGTEDCNDLRNTPVHHETHNLRTTTLLDLRTNVFLGSPRLRRKCQVRPGTLTPESIRFQHRLTFLTLTAAACSGTNFALDLVYASAEFLVGNLLCILFAIR